ncbi:MAG: glycosyltransferase [Flavobacterium sp.]|uniref:glycosyltransferase n=1 Tax=Flavobacterium sp. TaxID=239 RepID=UPI003263C7D8
MIFPSKKYKIALIGFSLSEGGGEKVMANLSVFFDNMGIEVHNIIVLDKVTYPYKGKLLNLGLLKKNSNGFLNKLKRLTLLKKYLKQNNFDFIIDFRPRTKHWQELIIAKFIYKSSTIYTIHSYWIHYYMPNNSFLTRLIYNHCYANVAIVKPMKELVEIKHHLTNVATIANPVNINEILNKWDEPTTEIDFDYIIAIGQYESNVKQFDKLIEAYANSILPKKEIHLVILGKGNNEFYQNIAAENDILEWVHFLGYQDNPFKFLKKARFLVLSSKNEGFANVLVESLVCQTPVVAFDCLCGPSEIIIDKKNGLLVENQNINKLTEAINLFINDQELYDYCKKNAFQSIQHFTLENIGKQWLRLMKMEDILNNNPS